jgi:hypothetical protein
MNALDLIRAEWPSILLACVIALMSGPLFGLTHDLYQILVSPWLTKVLERLRARLSRGR